MVFIPGKRRKESPASAGSRHPRKGNPGPIPAVSNPSLSYHDNRRGDVSRSFGEKSTITLIARSRRNARAFRAATVRERLGSGGGGSTRSRSRLGRELQRAFERN